MSMMHDIGFTSADCYPVDLTFRAESDCEVKSVQEGQITDCYQQCIVSTFRDGLQSSFPEQALSCSWQTLTSALVLMCCLQSKQCEILLALFSAASTLSFGPNLLCQLNPICGVKSAQTQALESPCCAASMHYYTCKQEVVSCSRVVRICPE